MQRKGWLGKLQQDPGGCAQRVSDGGSWLWKKGHLPHENIAGPVPCCFGGSRGKSLSVSAGPGRELGCPCSPSMLLFPQHSGLILIMSHPG